MTVLEKEYDVIVVGSGAAGGMAAHRLTEAGASVLMLEAGREYDPTTETPMFDLPSDAPLHGASTPDKEGGFYDCTVGGGWDVPGEPYTIADGSEFKWWRARMLGGRTNHWGRMSLRFGPYDFQSRTRDGMGVDWPIGYKDLAPYYDKVEELIGVFGDAEGFENSPDSPPGLLHKPPRFRAFEAWMQMVMERKHNIPLVPAHMAILTREHRGRPPCLYATDCLRGCSIGANFQSTTVLLPPARATGRLTVRTHAHVAEVTLGRDGKANGVIFVDSNTGERHNPKARAVVLGASTLETARILMLSQSPAHRDGIGANSGHLGRNLMDTPSVAVGARVSQLEGLPAFNDEGVTLFHAYAPWWGYGAQRAGAMDFAKGFHLEMWGGRRLPEMEDMLEIAELTTTHGAALHEEMRRLYGSVVWLMGRGEMVPNAASYCELDTATTDRHGLPVLRFHWDWGEEATRSCRKQREVIADIFKSMNAEILTDLDKPIGKAIRPGGQMIHEAGAARMSMREADGVINANGAVWGVPNLYVVDGAAFPSMPDKNPTLTILALAWRAADHLIAAMQSREI